jgi:hypothetical protein
VKRLAPAAAALALLCSGCATGITSTAVTVGPNSASFVGKVVSDSGGQVEYWAQYGLTTSYGSETVHQTIDVPVNTLVTVQPVISGLQRATTYHYRLCASDSQQKGGPGCGQDQHLTTQSVGCGDTVTTDVRLTGDLDCGAQAAGLIVGADGVDINLAGRTMFSDIGVGGGGPRAIDNSGGYDDLTVRNGTLPGWGFDVVIDGGSRNRILDVSGLAAGNGVTIDGGSANEIRRSDFFGRSFGIKVTDSDGLIVADTEAQAAFSSAIDVSGDLVRIVRSEAPHSAGPIGPNSGIQLVGAGGRLVDNLVDGGWDAGNIAVYGPNNTLLDNVARNAVLFPQDPNFSPASGDGIFIGSGSSGTVLRRNQGNVNEGDGIDVRSPGVKLEDNSAAGNGAWGILAVPGVTDLGGNTASGNGAGQCSNVFCP